MSVDFPLNFFLRMHSRRQDWGEMPQELRLLFPGKDRSILNAAFYQADPKFRKNQFLITQTLSGQSLCHFADIVVLAHPTISILFRYTNDSDGAPEARSIRNHDINSFTFQPATRSIVSAASPSTPVL